MFERIALLLAYTATVQATQNLGYRYNPIAERDTSSPLVSSTSNATSAPSSIISTSPASLITGTSPNSPHPSQNLTAYCAAQFSSYVDTYNPTGKLTTSTETDYAGYDSNGNQTGTIITQTYTTTTMTLTDYGYMAYQQGGAKPPCCNTCRMSAGTIQFYFWPDLETAAPSASTTLPHTTGNATVAPRAAEATGPVTAVAPNGFVFTSPSVYMAFSSIFGKNWCQTVGDVWYNTTIGFMPDEISTVQAYEFTYSSYYLTTEAFSGSSSTVTVWDSYAGTRSAPGALQYTNLARNCSTISGYNYFPDDPQNGLDGGWENDACHPLLALPPSLLKRQQAWADADCAAGDGYGAYDPPVALTPADSVAGPTAAGNPAPGSTSTPTSAPATTTVSALPDNGPTTSSKAADPATSPARQPTAISPSDQYSNDPTAKASEPPADPTTSEKPSETTYIVGGDSSLTASASIANPPIVQPSAASVDDSSGGGDPATKDPVTYTVVQQTIDGSGHATAVTYTTKLDPTPPTYTEVRQSTLVGGQVTQVTMQSAMSGASILSGSGSGDGEAPGSYTVLQQTTLANGQTIVVSTVIPLTPGDLVQPAQTTAAPAAVITVGGSTYVADSSSRFVINGQTVSTGGETVTINNTPVAVLAGGSSAVIAGSTVPLAAAVPPMATDVPAAVITVAGHTYTADASSHFVVDGQTLSAGGTAVDIHGTPVAVLPGGSSAVIGSSTVAFSSAYTANANAHSITLGNDVVKANPSSGYVVAPGTTLSVGGASVTVDSTAYALKTNSAGQTMLVAGAADPTSTMVAADYILSALGVEASSDTAATGESGTASATASRTGGVRLDGTASATSNADGDGHAASSTATSTQMKSNAASLERKSCIFWSVVAMGVVGAVMRLL